VSDLSARNGRLFRWRAVNAFHMDYELRDESRETVASLQFRSACGSMAIARSGEEGWSFKRIGFFKPRVTIRIRGRHQNLAVFTPSGWSGNGTLECAGEGSCFPIRVDVEGVDLAVYSGDSAPLLTVCAASGSESIGQMEIWPPAGGPPPPSWMACFAWYLVLIRRMDSAVETATLIAVIT
jgi:hypothetical protein